MAATASATHFGVKVIKYFAVLCVNVALTGVTPNIMDHIGDGFLRVKWPNQQCQSTEGRNKNPRIRNAYH